MFMSSCQNLPENAIVKSQAKQQQQQKEEEEIEMIRDLQFRNLGSHAKSRATTAADDDAKWSQHTI